MPRRSPPWRRAATAIRQEGEARELVWLLEHPPLYTAGTSADPAELIAPDRFPVHAGRPRRAATPITAPASASAI